MRTGSKIAIFAILGFIILAPVWYVTRFDLPIVSPITTETFDLEWKEKKSLVPDYFEIGETRQSVEKKLKKQGFGDPTYSSDVRFYMFDLEENSVAYENRYASLLCDNSAGVIVTYEKEKLVQAVVVYPGSSCV